MFHNREDTGRHLAAHLKGHALIDPLVLAIPRGGVVVGAALAHELGAELDVILARKLRAPGQPELAIGAITEDEHVYLNPLAGAYLEELPDYLPAERRYQRAEIGRRSKLLRGVRPKAAIAGRSIIVTDDGIATGATMIAALQALRNQRPLEIIVAVPLAAAEHLEEVRRWCDEVVCLHTPESFWAIGQFYEDFRQVEDEQVVALLQRAEASRAAAEPVTPHG